jgi:hypothetical protein
MATIKLRRGLRVNLPATGSPGEAFFCYDTGELFIANNSGNMVEINSYESNFSEAVYDSEKTNAYTADDFVLNIDRTKDIAINNARNEIYGGGTLTWSTDYCFKWTNRIIIIGAGYGSHFSTAGYFQIDMPAQGVSIQRYNSTAVTVTSNGIPLANWDTLYYKLPIGQNGNSNNANFIIYPYTGNGTAFALPYNAIPLALRNADNNYLYIFNRQRIPVGGSTTY